MTGDGRYLAAFYEHFPSRSYFDPPDWTEREDLDFASDYPDEVAAVVGATVDDYEEHTDRWTSLSYEIIDTETEQRWTSAWRFLSGT